MTIIYIPIGSDGYEFCHPTKDDDFVLINSLRAEGLQNSSQLPPMSIIKKDEGVALLHSDSPWLGSDALIFRENALIELENLLKNTRLYQFNIKSETLSLCYPPFAAEALNENDSVIDRFSDGRIMIIRKYVFFKESISGLDIFKIKNLRVSPTFVSQTFVDLWISSGLKGLDFNLIWSDETINI